MLIYKPFRWVQHIQKLTFSEQISMEITNCSWCLILDIMFWDFGASWRQNTWFWDPLAPSGTQNGAQDRPYGTQKRVPRTWRWHFLGVPEPTCFQDRFRSSPGHPFGWFWYPLTPKSWILVWFVDTFWNDFRNKYGHRFASSRVNVPNLRWFREAFISASI